MSQKAVHDLPKNYNLKHTLDLNKNVKLAIGLNLASLVLFAVFGVLFYWLLIQARPGFLGESGLLATGWFSSNSALTQFLVIALVYLGMIVLHEAIHGLFFWVYTQEKPKFGFRGLYAYAGAPSWYLYKWPYLVVGLAPLVTITVVGFIVMLLVPSGWIFPVLLFITLNASGAVGDIYAFFWIVPKTEDVLVRDFGDRMEIYAQGRLEESGEPGEE